MGRKYGMLSRIFEFKPITQSERFDPDGEFIRKYLPGWKKYLQSKSIFRDYLANKVSRAVIGQQLLIIKPRESER